MKVIGLEINPIGIPKKNSPSTQTLRVFEKKVKILIWDTQVVMKFNKNKYTKGEKYVYLP